MGELRQRLDDASADLRPAGTLGEIFDALGPELRRPVEIFGLLHLAANRGWQSEELLESYAALRHDGTRRTFSVPRLPVVPFEFGPADFDRPEQNQPEHSQPEHSKPEQKSEHSA